MSFGERNDIVEQVIELRVDSRHLKDLMEEKFGRIDGKFAGVNERFTYIEDKLEQRFAQVDKEFVKVGTRIEQLDRRFDRFEEKVERKFEIQADRFDTVRDALDSARHWAIGLYIALAGTLLYVIARNAKWI